MRIIVQCEIFTLKMENMQACCLEGCESYKYITKQKIGYFKFPTRNKSLLQKWLSQIRIPNWLPTDNHRICSRHFHIDDIDFSHKQPKLKTNAIPMIFPLKHFKNIYIDKINTNAIQGMKTNVYLNKIESTHQIIMSNPNSILHNPTKSSSMVLLCTPTEESNNISNLQISSLSTSNISMKKIPIKNDLMQCCNSKSPKLSALNPYLLIISDNKEPKIPFKNESTKKTHAILKLQIDKKLNTITPNNLIIDSVVEENRFNIIKRNTNNLLNTSSMEEIEVDDISSTKIVVFKFDSSTGKITVLKKEKFGKNTEISRETLDVKQSFKFDIIKSSNNNIKNRYLAHDDLIKLTKNQHKLINVKENIQMLSSAPIINSNSGVENINKLNTIKNIESLQNFIINENLEIENNRYDKRLINPIVKTTIGQSKNNQHLDQDLCIIKHYVQKRKLDVKSINSKINKYEEFKDTKKLKRY